MMTWVHIDAGLRTKASGLTGFSQSRLGDAIQFTSMGSGAAPGTAAGFKTVRNCTNTKDCCRSGSVNSSQGLDLVLHQLRLQTEPGCHHEDPSAMFSCQHDDCSSS